MSRRFGFGLVLVALVVALTAALPVQAARDQVGAQRYIVVLNKSVVSAAAVANEHARGGAQVDLVFENALKGYAAVIPNDRLAAIRADKRVAYVEQDGDVQAAGQVVPWGIDFVDADVSTTRAGDG